MKTGIELIEAERLRQIEFALGEKYKTNASELVKCLSITKEPNATKHKEFLIFEYVETGYMIIVSPNGEVLSGHYGEKVIPHAKDL